MQNILLQLDTSEIQNTIDNTVTTLIEQITPELPHTSFITDLAFIMIIGAIVTLAFFKIKQPLIIGYLFAGMLLGPLSPFWSWLLPEGGPTSALGGVGILSDIEALNLFAEIGVILLLFVIGIEFPYSKIKSIGRKAIGIGNIGLFLTMGVIFYVSTLLGLQFMDALFISAALSISSTAIIVKIFEDTGQIKKESSLLVLGILIVEDVIAVILISSLQSIALVGTVSIESIIAVVAVAIALIVGTFTIGTRVIPPLIDRVAATEHREILLLSVLGLCFGYALFANIVGLSVAIGAFLAGVLVAESKSAEVSKLLSSPIKDMFVAIFFISVGALMDVSQLENYIVIAIVLIAVSIGMKFGGNMLGNIIFRQKRGKALRSAFSLAAPRGEFSIVIVKVGADMGAVSAFLFPMIGMISIITAIITPFLMKAGDKIIPAIEKKEDV
ncbi:cation:proton antiporter [Marine Group I thaumarchaeote]|uniref:Cation:proton antiporter n=1 Tax=Marine Group I thaumarchaeote TaxID=2511932 RepID=A0A7K4MV23_9ARCH|nr:MAG: cation:proton antiporter [Nitrosopumilus sp. YT1]NMI81711.1 cation:proton antiporter [Candidatus Nitrosopumilus sp. MTA1]NWJ19649.1 cation:proton antiporter [Marine Group I thaumarchaeote]NWJ28044.1 cation:proton antiporter [Marine Group I thaumarchaeote]NWJ56783.1 cation:proton antiporter [Marine Group I thaumarchaeote]